MALVETTILTLRELYRWLVATLLYPLNGWKAGWLIHQRKTAVVYIQMREQCLGAGSRGGFCRGWPELPNPHPRILGTRPGLNKPSRDIC